MHLYSSYIYIHPSSERHIYVQLSSLENYWQRTCDDIPLLIPNMRWDLSELEVNSWPFAHEPCALSSDLTRYLPRKPGKMCAWLQSCCSMVDWLWTTQVTMTWRVTITTTPKEEQIVMNENVKLTYTTKLENTSFAHKQTIAVKSDMLQSFHQDKQDEWKEISTRKLVSLFTIFADLIGPCCSLACSEQRKRVHGNRMKDKAVALVQPYSLNRLPF